MKKWKERSSNEKWMIVIIALLVVAILTRWGYVSREVSGAFGGLFETKDRTERTVPARSGQ